MPTNPTPPVVPGIPPDRSDRVNFSARATAAWTWLKDHGIPDVYGLAQNAFANATEALASAVAAALSAAAALASQQAAAISAAAAALSAGAAPWNAATAYTQDQRATDPTNKRVYYRKVPGTTATQPSGDSTNWGIAPGQFVDAPVTAGATAQCAIWVNTQLRNSGSAMTATVPAGLSNGDRFKVAPQNGRTDNVLNLSAYLAKGPSGIVYDTTLSLELMLPMEFVYDAPNNTLNWE